MAYWHLLWLRHFVIGLNAPLCHPIRSTVKTNRDTLAHVFPRTSDWFIGFSVSFVTFSSKLKVYYGFLTSLLSSSKLTLNVGSSRANRLRAFENCAKSFYGRKMHIYVGNDHIFTILALFFKEIDYKENNKTPNSFATIWFFNSVYTLLLGSTAREITGSGTKIGSWRERKTNTSDS